MDNPYEIIVSNQERIIALLEQIAGGSGEEVKAPAKRTPAKKAAAAKEPTITKGQATDAVNKVKTELGTPAAKKIMTDHKVAKLADMTDEQIEPVYKAALAALAKAADEEEEEEEEDL